MRAHQALLCTALIALSGCAPGRSTLLPSPEPVSAGESFAFREWLPDAVPSFIEGRVHVTEHGLMVTTGQTRCHEVPTPPTSATHQFNCGGILLTFSRKDPTLQARYSYFALIPGSTSTCADPSWPTGGGIICGYNRATTAYQRVERAGRLVLVASH